MATGKFDPEETLFGPGKDMMELEKEINGPDDRPRDESTWIGFGVDHIDGVDDPHITLAYLGKHIPTYHVPHLEELCRRLVKAIDMEPFDVAAKELEFWHIHRVMTVSLPRNVFDAAKMFRQTLFSDAYPISLKYSFNPHITLNKMDQTFSLPPAFITRKVRNVFVQTPIYRKVISLDWRNW